MSDKDIPDGNENRKEEESNVDRFSTNRRACLKALAAGGFSLAGVSSISGVSTAQVGEIPAPFCGDAATGPTNPPGQAGQCIDCVRDVCENEPIAVALFSGLSGNCFTLAAGDPGQR